MTTRPNILVLMVDQLGARALSDYGHPLVKSPNIDTIAARGTVFENFYSNFPLCAPARLAFMTGRLCSNIGAWDNAAQLPPDIPTFAESGVPGYAVQSWYGVFVPAKTPSEIVNKMQADVAAALADPAVQARFEPLGVTVASSTPQELAARMKAEAELWGPIIKAANIRGE